MLDELASKIAYTIVAFRGRACPLNSRAPKMCSPIDDVYFEFEYQYS